VASFVSYGQLLATFSAAGSKYAATVSGSHSLKEAVFVTSFALRWLKGSFHCSIALCPIIVGEFIISVKAPRLYLALQPKKRAKVLLFSDTTKYFLQKR